MIKSSIYYGEVLHSRNHPKKHSFKYKYRSLFNKHIYDFKLKKFHNLKFSFSSYDFHEKIISEKIEPKVPGIHLIYPIKKSVENI